MDKRKLRKSMSAASERTVINIFSFIVTCGVLFLATQVAGVDKVETTGNLFGKQADYTDTYTDVNYLSYSEYHSGGLGWLYGIVHKFGKVLLPNPIPKGMFTFDENNKIKHAPDDVVEPTMTKSYFVLTVTAASVFFIGFVMLLCGLCFLCNQCCCSGKTSIIDDEKKHHRSLARLTTVLIVCSTLLVFCTVGSLITNLRLKNNLDDLPNNLNTSIKDVRQFLNVTNLQYDILVKKNFDEFADDINDTILDYTTNLDTDEFMNVRYFDDLKEFVDDLPKVSIDLNDLNKSLTELKSYVKDLKIATLKLKSDLDDIAQNSQSDLGKTYEEMEATINKLEIKAEIEKLPDLTSQIKEVNSFIGPVNNAHIGDGRIKLVVVIEELYDTIDDGTKEVMAKIRDTGKKISSGFNNITTVTHNVTKKFIGYSDHDFVFDHIGEYNKVFEKPRWYSSLAASVLLILVSTLVIVGLIFVIFGADSSNSTCSKSCGRKILKWGVFTILFFSWIPGVLIYYYIMIGTVGDQALCSQLHNPKNSSLFDLLDTYNTSKLGFNVKISDAIVDCHQNQTIYNIFNGKEHFDINKIRTYLTEEDIADAFKNITMINYKNTELLTTDQLAILEELANSTFTKYDSGMILNVLYTNLIDVSHASFEEQLKLFVYWVKKVQPDLENKVENFKSDADDFWKLYNRTTVKITTIKQKVYDLFVNENENLEALLKGFEVMQKNLRENAQSVLQKEFKNLSDEILRRYQDYSDRLISKTQNEVGNCAPLSNVYNATRVQVCGDIVNTMNGFWFTLFCAFLIFILTVVVALRLSKLLGKKYRSIYYLTDNDAAKLL